MNSERFLELLARKWGNNATEAELKELDQLLQLYPEYQQLVSLLNSIQAKKSKHPAQSEEAITAEGWEKLQQKMKELHGEQSSIPAERPPRRLFLRAFSVAAIWAGVIIMVGLVWLAITNNGQHKASTAQVQTEAVPNGKPEMKTLPDGSVVWINSGSSLRFARNPEKNSREVYLEGEAYFKVFHDAAHPFIVHAGNISVQALGTEFNVSAYPGEEKVETTLITGKIQVSMEEKPDQKIILVPNEKLTFNTKPLNLSQKSEAQKETSFTVETIETNAASNTVAEVAWVQDRLAFHNESFLSLSKKMSRRYNVQFVFKDAALKNESLSGTFENENIQKALSILQMTTPFHYQVKGDSVFIQKFRN